jgi:hypothetical protein
MTEPCASSTALETMFSEAINSISWRWRPSSLPIAPKISGSTSASGLLKKLSAAGDTAVAVAIIYGPHFEMVRDERAH